MGALVYLGAWQTPPTGKVISQSQSIDGVLTAHSLCGNFHWTNKVDICYVMIKGKQRGLPVALDHAQASAVGDTVRSYEGNFEDLEIEERVRRMSHANAINAEAEGEVA